MLCISQALGIKKQVVLWDTSVKWFQLESMLTLQQFLLQQWAILSFCFRGCFTSPAQHQTHSNYKQACHGLTGLISWDAVRISVSSSPWAPRGCHHHHHPFPQPPLYFLFDFWQRHWILRAKARGTWFPLVPISQRVAQGKSVFPVFPCISHAQQQLAPGTCHPAAQLFILCGLPHWWWLINPKPVPLIHIYHTQNPAS